jgi:hypothetical protein
MLRRAPNDDLDEAVNGPIEGPSAAPIGSASARARNKDRLSGDYQKQQVVLRPQSSISRTAAIVITDPEGNVIQAITHRE